MIVQRVQTPKTGTEIEIEIRAFWNEKDRMLKLAFPVRVRPGRYLGQVACGVEELPANGDEAVSPEVAAVVSEAENSALTVINDGTYGSDFTGRRAAPLAPPLARPRRGSGRRAHSARPGPLCPADRSGRTRLPVLDQRRPVRERLTAIEREALAKNEAPMSSPISLPGTGKRPGRASSSPIPPSRSWPSSGRSGRKDLIIRLFEPTGAPRTTELALPASESEDGSRAQARSKSRPCASTRKRKHSRASIFSKILPDMPETKSERPVSVVLSGIGGMGAFFLRELCSTTPPKAEFRIEGAVDPAPERCPYLPGLNGLKTPIFPDLEMFYLPPRGRIRDHLLSPSTSTPTRPAWLWPTEAMSSAKSPPPADDPRAPADDPGPGQRRPMGRHRLPMVVQRGHPGPQGRHPARPFRPAETAQVPLSLAAGSMPTTRRNDWAGRKRDRTGAWILDSPANNAMAHDLHNMFYVLGGDSPGERRPGRGRSRALPGL